MTAPHPLHATPDDLYASPPPWDIGRPQHAFQALADDGALRGRVLDVGCGTGEHTLLCASLGLDATGIDLASTALRTARAKARQRDLSPRFRVHDATRLTDLGETFDTVLDCGLFHALSDDDRAAYVAGLRQVLEIGGRYFMLGMSDAEPRHWGGRMRRMTREFIDTTFAQGWCVDAIEPATIEITTDRTGVRAWLATITRS